VASIQRNTQAGYLIQIISGYSTHITFKITIDLKREKKEKNSKAEKMRIFLTTGF
jgi:HSP90 family molecular chaperone